MKNILHLVESSVCYVFKSGEGGGDDLYPGNQHDSKQQVSIKGILSKPHEVWSSARVKPEPAFIYNLRELAVPDPKTPSALRSYLC